MSELISNCKQNPLHLIGQIQSHGQLLAVSHDSGKVLACSANAEPFLGLPPAAVLGRHWSELPVADFDLDTLTGYLTTHGARVPTLVSGRLAGQEVTVLGHGGKDLLLVEIEPASAAPSAGHGDRLVFLQELAACQRPEDAAQLVMCYIAEISGFDRVMLYQFLPDWHGRVDAEILRPGVGGFLGLHFPAGDIPENARRLYTVNLQRSIADVDGKVADILTSAPDTALDLTHVQLRAVHPVHIQYLKDMGVSASFSVSIVVADRLWGLVACHHLKPATLGFRQRLLCEELVRVVSLHMSGLLARESGRRESALEMCESLISNALRSGEQAGDTLGAAADQLLASFAADAVWIMLDDQSITRRLQLDAQEQQALAGWLAAQDQRSIAHRNTVAPTLVQQPGLVTHASGLLHIPLDGRGFITLLRKEQIENVQWAGQIPERAPGPAAVLGPRSSFKAWTEEVHGTATPWSEMEIEAAGSLQEVLLAWFEKQDLEHLALEDDLTGLANRRRSSDGGVMGSISMVMSVGESAQRPADRDG